MKSVIHEHILVCLSSAPSNGNIIRTAGKMSQAFGGSFTALYVRTRGAEQMGAEDRQRLQRNTRLAEKLGATVATVSGEDVAFQIAEYARLSKVTKIVMGRSTTPRHRLFAHKPLTEQLIELAPHLDVYIIPDIAGENRSSRNPAEKKSLVPTVRDIAISAGILALTTVLGFAFHAWNFTEANTVTIYILGVLLTALFTKNYLCSILSSLASVMLFNFFFTEPRLSLYAYESGYPVTFAIMLFASLLTGTLANRLADNARESSQAAWRTQVLLETTQRLQQAADEPRIFQVAADQARKLLNRPVEIRDTHGYSFTASQSGQEIDGADGQHRFSIRSGGEVYGELRLPGAPLEPFESGILQSILGEAALTLESRRNAREKEEAAVLAKNEQLRANLLRSISHDLRTPLTSISGNAENLLNNGANLEESDKNALLTDIYDDSIWLIQLVENLLAITKIGEGRTRLNLTTELVDEVITESLRHIRRREIQHNIETDLEELLLAKMDARLISQVIINLVDNALKYTPTGSTIRITAKEESGSIIVKVADNGPGIPDEQKSKAFDMFFTGDTKIADCRRSMGLGLTLCKSIIVLHGGEITLTDNTPSGCVFTFILPASEVEIYE